MEERLIRPYEISVWEDKLVQDGNTTKIVENKLAVIGSDTMTGLNKVYSPIFNQKSNGERTLTFSLKYKYFDPYSGDEDVINPFAALLVNERRIKLHYDGEWYEFIVKDHTESSDEYEWTYMCSDAFVLELSKKGYNITFDTELNNNQGTARELIKETIKDTDWRLGNINPGKQLVAEPLYKATLYSITDVNIINANNDGTTVPSAGSDIYVFYSYVKNENGKFVQFIIRDDNRNYTIDDKNVITDTNFRIQTELVYAERTFNGQLTKGFWKINNENYNLIISLGETENRYQANRLVYKQLTTYDPVMGRTVECFKSGNREAYKYSDSDYVTSTIISNFFTNGDNFNSLEDGTIQGWNPYNDYTTNNGITKLQLITKPELGTGKPLVDLNSLKYIEGFLKVHFNGPYTVSNGKIYNTVFNSGIKDNLSSIGAIQKGEEFIFRWRALAGSPSTNGVVPTRAFRLIVAKYTQDTPNAYSYYYKHIKQSDIVLQFTGTSQELNNVITGGTVQNNNTDYVIDGVVQTVSTKYIYRSENTNYIWDIEQGKFVPYIPYNGSNANQYNYNPYYYVTAKAQKSVSKEELTNGNYGIFIYSIADDMTAAGRTYSIQDIQLMRCVRDGSGAPVLIGNIPTTTYTTTDYYYLKPTEGATADEIETYATLEALEASLNNEVTFSPVYNEDSEKILSITASQSNCFNILQTIGETFEGWIDLIVEHNTDGSIKYDADGLPKKYVYLREYVGTDNQAGFKYGINLQSIERDVNSEEIVTKLIVESTQSDVSDTGYISIADASSNLNNESYILNFDYYYNQGLLDRTTTEAEKKNYFEEIAGINKDLKELETQRRTYEDSLTKLNSDRTIYTELVESAQDMQNQALEEFEKETSESYDSYRQKHSTLSESSQLTEVDEILNTLGELYTSSITINNYSGILSNTEKEYQSVKNQLYGYESYTVKIWVEFDVNNERHVFIELSNFLPGFGFSIGGYSEISTVSKRYFDIITNSTSISITQIPNGYKINLEGNMPYTYTINNNKVAKLRITRVDNTSVVGLTTRINDLIDTKKEKINDFENKYVNFIQEGTWSSTDYIDSELYYLDALQVSNTSAQPTISYTIDVVEISQLEGFEWYKFDVGDKTYVEDTEFFGWHIDNIGTEQNPTYIYTPAREEVIVSEVEWHLDEPDQNKITVQNYKTRFEDLFQRISATVQTVQYNEAKYAKISTLLDANGTINQNVLVDSINKLGGKEYTLTSNGSIIILDDSLIARNLTNSANAVKINSSGIHVTSDGGTNWRKIIDGQGIDIGAVYTGSLNTNEITIGNKDNFSFRWDSYGISAFGSQTVPINRAETQEIYDLQTYVRFDQYGLYGIKNGGTFKAQNLQQVLDKAHFAVTWDGFFIKNSYEGGGRVEITSDNDFRVLNTVNQQENEKVKIGALEWLDENQQRTTNPEEGVGAPILYGIRIKNDAGATVMQTDDDGDLTITGTINANKGNIGGMAVDDDKLSMDTIVLEPGVGIYSTENIDNQPAFIISDIDGGATFRNINALGGTLGQLTVQNTITVGDATHSGIIKSYGYTAGNNGWAIKSDGSAEFQNAIVRGEVNAGSGTFYGQVQVGTGNPHILIDGPRALIRSSNYSEGAGYGWMINKDGDAVFNNITARGAIKTAVFEYAEIQAVGGIFIFRPSSTIKSARISGDDLILKVEKPLLFAKISYNEVINPDSSANPHSNGWYEKTNYGYKLSEDTVLQEKQYYIRDNINNGSWCKISNYLSDGTPADSTIQNILLTNGLTHVYQISNVNTLTSEVTLENAIAFVNAVKQIDETVEDVLKQLEGGALIDMGRKDGSSNYGIGVNSSDNTVNLPARAISLFETVIDETKDVKVSYNYKGILGTLPMLPTTDVNDSIYNQRMVGTQGIFTNNMYIGDDSQFIAFYEDEHGHKQLRIKANQIVYEVTDEHGQGTGVYHDVNDIEAEGTPGPPGEDAVQVNIESNIGNFLVFGNSSAVLTCHVIKGTTEITSQVQTFEWSKYDKDGNLIMNWQPEAQGVEDGLLVNQIRVSADDIDIKSVFSCNVTF